MRKTVNRVPLALAAITAACAPTPGGQAASEDTAGQPVVATDTSGTNGTAQVMILGTYHFANPGLDVVQVEVADILSPEKQTEVEGVVETLAAFRPTKVAVEVRAPSVPAMDSLYAAYRAGRHTLSRDEVQQLGFRLGDRFDLPRLHAIDHEGRFPFDAVMQYAEEHDPEFVQWVEVTLEAIGEQSNRRQIENTLAEILRQENDPAGIAEGHGHYLMMSGVGAGDTYVGADLLAAWYERNIRTFADLRAVAEPGDRVLVIFGGGHAAILREFVKGDPGMELVEPNEYLP